MTRRLHPPPRPAPPGLPARASSVIVSGGAIFTVCPQAPTGREEQQPFVEAALDDIVRQIVVRLLLARLGHLQAADQSRGNCNGR